jgi:hypothetical protein
MLRIGQMAAWCTSLGSQKYNELADFNLVGGDGVLSVSDITYQTFSSTE